MKKFLFILVFLMICIITFFIIKETNNKFDPVHILQTSKHSSFYPDSAEILYFGQVIAGETAYDLYISKLINGTGNRLTERLVVFLKDKYIGYYGLDNLPEYTKGDSIFFPCVKDSNLSCISSDQNNKITFTPNGPPEEVLFDGHFHIFDFVDK